MKKIILTQGKFALVDDEDFKWLNQWKWCFAGGYAVRSCNGKTVYMHRVIMSVPKDKEVDHVDGNKLDNRKFNLRLVTHQQNIFNCSSHKNSTSKFRGISWEKGKNRWRGDIQIDGHNIFLGYFQKEIDAAKVWNEKAKELFGEYVKVN